MATARFKDLVERCGRPEVHLSWSVPTKDDVLQRAVAQTRLLTIHQEGRGGKKDFATVGLHPGKFVQYLIFPRSLRHFLDRRIIGIDYASLSQELSVSLPDSVPRPARKNATRVAPAFVTKEKRKGSDRVIPFEASPPEKPKPPAKLTRPGDSVTATREPQKRAAAPLILLRPWFEEVAEAISEIKVGASTKARERLEALLSRNGLKPSGKR